MFSSFGVKPPASGFQSYSYSSLKTSPFIQYTVQMIKLQGVLQGNRPKQALHLMHFPVEATAKRTNQSLPFQGTLLTTSKVKPISCLEVLQPAFKIHRL